MIIVAGGSAVSGVDRPAVMPIGELTPYPGNARRGDVDLLVESIRELGQYRPIVVNVGTVEPALRWTVLAGNHTLEAMARLGRAEVAVTWVDVDAATARKIVLVDNRSNDLAGYDEAALVAELAALEGDWLATGWDEAELDRLLKRAAPEETPDASPQLGDLQFRLIVDCRDEDHQAELLDRFEGEGLPCRPLVS